MPFKQGNQHSNGRPKGSQNKISATVKESISGFMEEKLKDFGPIYDELGPEAKAKFLTSLLPYIIPKQRFVQYEDANSDIDRELGKRIESYFSNKDNAELAKFIRHLEGIRTVEI